MIIRSKIPQTSTSFFSLIIWPFVKMKVFVDRIYQSLLSMIWAELIKHEEKQYSELSHFIAFVVLSVFSMLFYHFEDLEDVVVLSFFALWLIDSYLTKRQFQANKFERIVLETQNYDVIWKSFTPGKGLIKERFKRADVSQVYIAPTTLMGGAFHTVQAQVWRIFLVTHEGFLIYEEKNATRALKKARELREYFKVPLEISNSQGNGDYAASVFRGSQHRSIWKIAQTASAVQIYKTFSIATFKKLIKSVLNEAGVFLFIVIMAGVMLRFGMLLTFLIGPKIGLESPSFTLNISFTGVLSFFAPKIDWITVIVFAFAFAMLFYSGWQHSREHRIIIDKKLLRYRIAGQHIAHLSTQEIEQLILLSTPKPALLIIDCHDKLIKIDRLEDEEEYEELYCHLLGKLDKFKVGDKSPTTNPCH
jgi:hypothetical protein